jgi:hypothetical protein
MKLINFITNNAIKLPPLGAVGCVHLVSSRSCARQHESCIAYRQCWILLFGLIQMRPSASTLSHLHCTAALDLITNYLRIHPSQSVGIARSLVRFVGIARSFVVARRYRSSRRSVSLVRFVSLGIVRSFRRSMSFARLVVIARRYRSVGPFVGLEGSDWSVGRSSSAA